MEGASATYRRPLFSQSKSMSCNEEPKECNQHDAGAGARVKYTFSALLIELLLVFRDKLQPEHYTHTR